jgi:RNA polymerase sigma-70 factor (ECF subfamily)
LKGGWKVNNLALVKKAIKGNETAFETLVKNESEKLYKTAFLYVRNKEDALDVLQETICKAFITIEHVRQPEFFNTWLTRILINTAINLLNKRKRLVMDEDFIHEVPSASNGDIEDKMDLMNAIHKLDEHYQTVIILFYYQNLSIHSIAKTMEKPENTIKTYLRRAKIELKNLIGGGNTSGHGTI